MSEGMIRVLISDDSTSMCKVISNVLNSDPRILVAGIVQNGKEAVEAAAHLNPDIITMDIHMPVMDGVEAAKQIMAYSPTPILILSNSVFQEGMGKVFQAISCGALDVMDKSELEMGGGSKGHEHLIEKIKFLSGVRVIRHPLAKLEEEISEDLEVPKKKVLDRIVGIASSTGGPKALLRILRDLPEDFPCGIGIVQHIAVGFVDGLVSWLDAECRIKVKIAEDGEDIHPGVAYVSPCEIQMKVEDGRKIVLADDPAYNGHKPSCDIWLASIGKVYGAGSIGVILTGMGRDGAEGIKAIKQLKGKTIAQDEGSCIVYGMPKEAVEMGVVDKIVPLNDISKAIVGMLTK